MMVEANLKENIQDKIYLICPIGNSHGFFV